MSNKRIKELKNLSQTELVAKIREVEAEMFQVKMKKMTGQLSDSASVWRLRKDIARMKTLQTASSAVKG